MPDYGHDLRFGFFLDPSTSDPVRTVEIACILDDLGYDLTGIRDHLYQAGGEARGLSGGDHGDEVRGGVWRWLRTSTMRSAQWSFARRSLLGWRSE